MPLFDLTFFWKIYMENIELGQLFPLLMPHSPHRGLIIRNTTCRFSSCHPFSLTFKEPPRLPPLYACRNPFDKERSFLTHVRKELIIKKDSGRNGKPMRPGWRDRLFLQYPFGILKAQVLLDNDISRNQHRHQNWRTTQKILQNVTTNPHLSNNITWQNWHLPHLADNEIWIEQMVWNNYIETSYFLRSSGVMCNI